MDYDIYTKKLIYIQPVHSISAKEYGTMATLVWTLLPVPFNYSDYFIGVIWGSLLAFSFLSSMYILDYLLNYIQIFSPICRLYFKFCDCFLYHVEVDSLYLILFVLFLLLCLDLKESI